MIVNTRTLCLVAVPLLFPLVHSFGVQPGTQSEKWAAKPFLQHHGASSHRDALFPAQNLVSPTSFAKHQRGGRFGLRAFKEAEKTETDHGCPKEQVLQQRRNRNKNRWTGTKNMDKYMENLVYFDGLNPAQEWDVTKMFQQGKSMLGKQLTQDKRQSQHEDKAEKEGTSDTTDVVAVEEVKTNQSRFKSKPEELFPIPSAFQSLWNAATEDGNSQYWTELASSVQTKAKRAVDYASDTLKERQDAVIKKKSSKLDEGLLTSFWKPLVDFKENRFGDIVSSTQSSAMYAMSLASDAVKSEGTNVSLSNKNGVLPFSWKSLWKSTNEDEKKDYWLDLVASVDSTALHAVDIPSDAMVHVPSKVEPKQEKQKQVQATNKSGVFSLSWQSLWKSNPVTNQDYWMDLIASVDSTALHAADLPTERGLATEAAARVLTEGSNLMKAVWQTTTKGVKEAYAMVDKPSVKPTQVNKNVYWMESSTTSIDDVATASTTESSHSEVVAEGSTTLEDPAANMDGFFPSLWKPFRTTEADKTIELEYTPAMDSKSRRTLELSTTALHAVDVSSSKSAVHEETAETKTTASSLSKTISLSVKNAFASVAWKSLSKQKSDLPHNY